MTDKKISELPSITGADVNDANDVLPIVDTSAATTKKITRAELFKSVSSVDINGGTIDGTVIGGSTPAAISGTTGTFSGNLTVDTDTLFVDATGNRVGIGTSSPATKLAVVGTGNTAVTIQDSSGVAYLDFTTGAGTQRILGGAGGTNSLLFYTGLAERMRIDSSGNVLCGSDGGGDIGSSTKRFKDLYLSGGVYLGGTGAANLLDDYEEGTWTPSLGGLSSVTYNYNLGSYRKVGSLVVAFWDLIVTASSGTFNTAINGLPFTVNPSMAGFSAIQHRSSDLFNAGAVGTGKLSGFAQRGAAYLTVQVEYQTNTSNGFGFANDPGFNGTGRSTGYIIYEST